ncbi:MAG: RNA-binding S4 domain-containing protein [Bacteroidota bacterium]|nr:RNA-binding S4 domain-containing protein [Bacteroidota bacterium]
MVKEFDLQGHEYIALNQLLKMMGLVETGGEANNRVDGGEVMVNGNVELQRRKKLRSGDKVCFHDHTIVIK